MNMVELNANALRIGIFLKWDEGCPFPDLSEITFRDSRYHLDFAAIMPAVEKMIALGFHVLITDLNITITGLAKNTREVRKCRIMTYPTPGEQGPFIYELYEAVVKFVTWYQEPHDHLIALN